jgi:hypothetical protein
MRLRTFVLFHAVWVLGEVGLQTAIGARRNVGGSLALHGHLAVPADDQRYVSKKEDRLRYFRELRLGSKTNSPRGVAVMPTNAACGAPSAPRVAMTARPRSRTKLMNCC